MAAKEFVLGVDQGGSGSRALVLDRAGRVRGYGYQAVGRLHPQPGWVEQRPTEIAESVALAIAHALAAASVPAAAIAACGITSQRDTVFAWDAATGLPIGNAITWQDLRTAPLVAALRDSALAGQERVRLGQRPGPYSAALHIGWRMRHDAAFRAAAAANRLRLSLAAGWLLHALGRPAEHALDYSLLQGMTIFDPRRIDYWHEWVDELGLPWNALPAPCPTLHDFGELRIDGSAIPVTALIADQQAALFGYDCHRPGEAATTHGTASFVNVVVGASAPPQGLCKTYLAWHFGGVPCYSLEADMTMTGAAVGWLQELGLLGQASELGPLAASVADSGGAVFVPAFNGLGVPSEDRSARGTILGMTLGTTRAHLARALLEAIGYQLRDIVDLIGAEAGVAIEHMRVGGGLAKSAVACQIQADILGLPLVRAHDSETSARGAALLAGLGAGFWADLAALPRLLDERAQVFEPQHDAERRSAGLARWHEALRRAQGWDEQRSGRFLS